LAGTVCGSSLTTDCTLTAVRATGFLSISRQFAKASVVSVSGMTFSSVRLVGVIFLNSVTTELL
jgi:hypothetical protein